MKSLFGQESMLFQFLSLLADIMILTILWLVGCLPIITAGASSTALYSCVMKLQKGDGIHHFKDFWQAFKSNFRQATALCAVVAMLTATVAADIYLVFFTEFNPGTVVKMFMLMLAAVMLMVSMYIFPLQAFFINRVGQTLKNALLMSIMYLPVTLVITLIHLIPFLVWLIIPEFFTRTLFLWATLGGGVIAYVCSKMFRRIFERHITEQPEEREPQDSR